MTRLMGLLTAKSQSPSGQSLAPQHEKPHGIPHTNAASEDRTLPSTGPEPPPMHFATQPPNFQQYASPPPPSNYPPPSNHNPLLQHLYHPQNSQDDQLRPTDPLHLLAQAQRLSMLPQHFSMPPAAMGRGPPPDQRPPPHMFQNRAYEAPPPQGLLPMPPRNGHPPPNGPFPGGPPPGPPGFLPNHPFPGPNRPMYAPDHVGHLPPPGFPHPQLGASQQEMLATLFAGLGQRPGPNH